jgi:hypothetical protein
MHEDLAAVQKRPAKKAAVKRKLTLRVPEKAVVVEINQYTGLRSGQHTGTHSLSAVQMFDARASALKAKAVVMVEAAPSSLCTQTMDRDTLEDLAKRPNRRFGP